MEQHSQKPHPVLVTSVDYSGSIKFQVTRQGEQNAYDTPLHVDKTRRMENSEFLLGLKRLVGKSSYSMKNRFFKLKIGTSFLACQQISWQFSRLNRVLCWNAFQYAWRQKSDGNAKLNLDELKEATCDVQSFEEAVPVLTHT